jgi:hypothetical protein
MNPALQKYAPLISSVFTFIIYLLTMSRGVMPIDAGELAASQYTFGISHPSGYPLFNLVGFLWSKLPIGSVIFRLNLLCAIWVALANFFMVKTAFLVLKNSFIAPVVQKKPAGKGAPAIGEKPQPSALLQLLAAISGIMVIAFCRTWWIQSGGVEVYSLHMALLAAFLFVFLRAYFKPSPTNKDWVISGVLMGLCFTNHIASFLVLPGVIILYFIKMKFTVHSLKSGLMLAAGGMAILILVYGLMMLRAGSSPLVNYGNPSTFEYLIRHVTGWQFQAFMGGDGKKQQETIPLFFQNFTNESAIIGLLLFLTGIVYTCMKNIKMAMFWGLHFTCTLIYASQFNIHDIENYFLLSYLSAGVFIAVAFYAIFTAIKGIEKSKAIYLVL